MRFYVRRNKSFRIIHHEKAERLSPRIMKRYFYDPQFQKGPERGQL